MRKFFTLTLSLGFLVTASCGNNNNNVNNEKPEETAPLTVEAETEAQAPLELNFDTFTLTLKQAGMTAEEWGINESKIPFYRTFRDEDDIEFVLGEMGFECVSRDVESGIDDASDEPYTCVHATYAKDDTTVNMDCGVIEIHFPSTEAKDAFMESVESNGYVFNSSWADGCYMYPGNQTDYWIGIFVYTDGNTVRMTGGGE